MGLDLYATAAQLEQAALRVDYGWREHSRRLERLAEVIEEGDADVLNRRGAEAQDRAPFPSAECLERPGVKHSLPQAPKDFSVLAVDGSHIDVERHLAMHCSLMNIGVCQLEYGSNPSVALTNTPYLAAAPEERRLVDPQSRHRSVLVEGPLLGIKRSVEEVAALAHHAPDLPEGQPALALVDGSLILWQLTGTGPPPGRYPEYVRKSFLEDGLLASLERLRGLARAHALAVGGYISLPGSSEVVNTLREEASLSDDAEEITDRELFARMLAPGERSALFGSRVSVVRDYYGSSHAVCFFYLNAGEEIARVEVPAWVAGDATLLELTHGLLLDQCRRGQGYPVALQEAHEQAVINGADREEFRRMVEELLAEHRLPVYTSEKQRSKQRRGV